MKKFYLFGLLLSLCAVPSVLRAQSTRHHVVFAVTSPDRAQWSMALGNIANLRKGLAPDPVDVEVVAFGPGIAMLKKDSAVGEELEKLAKDGVIFVGCENSMRRLQLTKADLLDGVGTVPSGIVEVVKKQEAGWSYIKAGQ